MDGFACQLAYLVFGIRCQSVFAQLFHCKTNEDQRPVQRSGVKLMVELHQCHYPQPIVHNAIAVRIAVPGTFTSIVLTASTIPKQLDSKG